MVKFLTGFQDRLPFYLSGDLDAPERRQKLRQRPERHLGDPESQDRSSGLFQVVVAATDKDFKQTLVAFCLSLPCWILRRHEKSPPNLRPNLS